MLHFLNCLLLCFGPHFVVYRSLGLSDDRGYPVAFRSGALFAGTQALKFFLLASLVPAFLLDSESDSPLFSHFLRGFFGLLDLFAIFYALTNFSGLGKFTAKRRILVLAIGWSFASSLTSFLIPLWIGARGPEFSWKFIEMSVESNIFFVESAAIIAAIWMKNRSNRPAIANPIIFATIAHAILFQPLSHLAIGSFGSELGIGADGLLEEFSIDSIILAARAIFALALAGANFLAINLTERAAAAVKVVEKPKSKKR